MVQGVNRRVIVVRAPDPKLFEQAIFIMREDAFQEEGVSPDMVLAEAQQVAVGYAKRNSFWGKRSELLKPVVCLAIGALLATCGWCLGLFLL
ncbi:MAG: translation initiation factor 2 [Intestinimonas sp.]|jgi:hypothetical protein|nr:translation initiation factor 2 [Intestinimonas sp.]